MTFRAKPVVKRPHRSWESRDRRNFLLNLGFGLVVVAAILILAIAAAWTWYDQHLAPVASVNGGSITKDDFIARYRVEEYRLNFASRRIRDELNAGRLTQAQAQAQDQFLQQRMQALADIALERLIDARIQAALGAELGVSVDDAAIDARMIEEATTPEQRHAWVIEVEPALDEDADEPTAAQKADAKKKADDALAEIRGGAAWEDVAKKVSTATNAANGGDRGWIVEESESLDPKLHEALFALEANGVTGVVEGEDGIFRIGRVSEIAPEFVNPLFRDGLEGDGPGLESYRTAARSDLLREALEDRVVADAIKPTVQRQVARIYLPEPQTEPVEGAIKVRHILYSPNDDPAKAKDVPADDAAWKKAEEEARAAHEALTADPGKFDAMARAESDEQIAESTGGKLGWQAEPSNLDPAFAAAIFEDGLEPGQLLEPVKTTFGWHVIQVLYFPPDLDQAKKIKAEATDAAAFAQLARDFSEDEQATDGGEAGWVARLQLDPALETAIFAAPVGSVTDPVVVAGDGIYLFRIAEEQTRAPEGDQLEELEGAAFGNWYAAKKAGFDVKRELGGAAS